MIEDFSNIENETINNPPEKVIGCNISNCVFNNVENTIFERCNINYSKFNTVSSFDKCNLVVCDLVDGSILNDSSNTSQEEFNEFNNLMRIGRGD